MIKWPLLIRCLCCYSTYTLKRICISSRSIIPEPSHLSSFLSESKITSTRVNSYYFSLLCLPSWCACTIWHPRDICLGTTSWGYRLLNPSRLQHLSSVMATNQILDSAPSPFLFNLISSYTSASVCFNQIWSTTQQIWSDIKCKLSLYVFQDCLIRSEDEEKHKLWKQSYTEFAPWSY